MAELCSDGTIAAMSVDDLAFYCAVVGFMAKSVLLCLSTIHICYAFSQIPCCIFFGPYSFNFNDSLLNVLGMGSSFEVQEYGTAVESRLLLDHIF